MISPLLLTGRWVASQKPEAAFLCFGALAMVMLFRTVLERCRSLARNRNRHHLSSRFSALLEGLGYDPVIAQATYCVLRDVAGIGFPILPTDHLETDLRLDEDALEQVLLRLTAMVGGQPRAGWYLYPLHTVQDLIQAVQVAAAEAMPVAA